MSVDVFLLINLLALIRRNEAMRARLPRPGRAPRTSCVIIEPRLPITETPMVTNNNRPDSIRLPSSVLTPLLGRMYSAVVPKSAVSIRDQAQPPKPLMVSSTLGSNLRGA